MATRRKVREWSCRRCGREPFHREVEKELGITPAEIRDLVERETDARYSDVYPPRENEFEITIDALELGDIDGGTLLRARMDREIQFEVAKIKERYIRDLVDEEAIDLAQALHKLGLDEEAHFALDEASVVGHDDWLINPEVNGPIARNTLDKLLPQYLSELDDVDKVKLVQATDYYAAHKYTKFLWKEVDTRLEKLWGARKERDKATAVVAALNKDVARLEGIPSYVPKGLDPGCHWTKAKSYWAIRNNVAFETRFKREQNDFSRRYEDAEGANIPCKIIPYLADLEKQAPGSWNKPIDRYTMHLIEALPTHYV